MTSHSDTSNGTDAGISLGPLPAKTGRTVGQLVNRGLVTCDPDTPVAEAAQQMRTSNCSSIVVVEAGKPVGIWTERDALKVDLSNPASFDRPIAGAMTPDPRSINEHATISEAGVRFKREGFRHLVVVDDDGAALGMLTQTDVVMNHGVEHYLTFRDVRSVMSPGLPMVPAGMPLADAARILREAKTDAAIVIADAGAGSEEGWDAPGIVTERDIVRMIAGRRSGPVGQAASRPVITVRPGATLLSARNLFTHHGIRHLAVRDDEGAFIGLLSFSDILGILQYEYVEQLNEALRERDDALISSRKDLLLARQVIEASLDAVMIVNADGLIEYVNPAFTRMTGYATADVVGHNPRILKSGRQDLDFYHKMWQTVAADGHWEGEIWNRRKDGEEFAERLCINTIRDEDGRIRKYAAIFTDITDRKLDEERIRNLAYFDPLTGLPNRRLLTDRLVQAVANADRHRAGLAVMFLDLDLFKRINDTLGHDVGDAVLVETARRLLACVRNGDSVARIGGDEFVILLSELVDSEDAAKLAERVIETVMAPMNFGGRELFVTTSIGIAVYPDDGGDADTLIKNADTAMYQAKEVGRNQFHLCSPAMNRRSMERLAMENRLKAALRNNEMTLAYQVKVDMVSNRVCGSEALVRWNSRELGPVPPSEFIPVAEKARLMPELGEWILRTACAQAVTWQARGLPPVRMAVNISPYQFLSGGFPDRVGRVLAETGLDPCHLEVELTESVLIEHPASAAAMIHDLDRMGVTIAIDDFGTNYSSLSVLRRLPIRALKIDSTFIAGLTAAFQERDLVKAIINLAHALEMKAVAEGVESRGQADILREIGCDEIQGYLVSRAVSPETIDSLFQRRLLA